MNAIELPIEALYADPNLGQDAVWCAGGAGDGSAVRVIRKRPDQVVGFGDSRAVMPTVLIDVRRVEVPTPASGDTVEFAGETFIVRATPRRDAGRLSLLFDRDIVMACACGANARLAAAFEATYGTPRLGGFSRLPFVSCSLGAEQDLIASDRLGYGRDALPPIRDVISDTGDIVVPIDLRAFGRWLRLLAARYRQHSNAGK